MSRLAPALFDNAMLYKDVTQWLRTRAFGALFISLLGGAELICVLFALAEMQPGNAGRTAFMLLASLLGVYGLTIAVGGHMMTSREFSDRTFELYAVAGMSLEKMVLGKLASMMVRFLFGFFCVIPFMFFAYLLGGLDFYQILTLILAYGLAAPPLYQFSLLTALHLYRSKGTMILGRLALAGFIVLMLMFVPQLLFIYVLYGGGGGGSTDFIKSLVALDPAAWGEFGVFLVFYVLVNLLMFFISAQAVRPATDSRETSIYFLLFLLCCAWLWGMERLALLRPEEAIFFASHGIFILLCALGVFSFYRKLGVPIMVRRRSASARWPVRVIYWLFQPGPVGYFRCLVLFLLAYGAFCHFVLHGARARAGFTPTGIPLRQVMYDVLALPIMTPFFIVFPIGVAYWFRAFAQRHAALRNVVICFWVIGGVALQFLLMFRATRGQLQADEIMKHGIYWISMVISPVSALVADYIMVDVSPLFDTTWLTIVFGVFGLVMMYFTLRRRQFLEGEMLDAIPAGRAADSSEPPPLPPSDMESPPSEAPGA